MIIKLKKVFTPNATSDLLVKSSLKMLLKKNQDVLDLGCGTGFVGLTVAKNSKFLSGVTRRLCDGIVRCYVYFG